MREEKIAAFRKWWFDKAKDECDMSWNRYRPDLIEDIMETARIQWPFVREQFLQHYSFPGYPG